MTKNSDVTKWPAISGCAISQVNEGVYTLSIQDFSVNSGPCFSPKEAIDRVLNAINAWVSAEMPAATPQVPQTATSVEDASTPVYEFIREIPDGPVGPVLRRLIDKFGHKKNAEYAKLLGMRDGIDPITFSGGMAGQGSREYRVAIAVGLKQRPSAIWPARTPYTRVMDDRAYDAAIGSSRTNV